MRPRVEPSELLELGTPTPAILFKLGIWTPDEDRILPRRGYGYFPGMSSEELYDSTRAWWVLSLARAAAYRYAVAIHQGVTRGVWEINDGSWRPSNTPPIGRSRTRWAFEGRLPSGETLEAFVGQSGRRVPPTRPDGRVVFGSGNPVAYWPS
jgi:hypothetical protein